MLVNKLNHLLANLVVEYHKLQNFHWYIKGSDFFTVHAKLEEYYNDINKAVDEVAESSLLNLISFWLKWKKTTACFWQK